MFVTGLVTLCGMLFSALLVVSYYDYKRNSVPKDVLDKLNNSIDSDHLKINIRPNFDIEDDLQEYAEEKVINGQVGLNSNTDIEIKSITIEEESPESDGTIWTVEYRK